MSLLRAAAGSVGSTLFGTLFVLATGVLTARALGPAGKGAYTLAILIPHITVNFCMLGLTTALSYFLAKDRNRAGTALGTSLAVVMVVAGASAVVLVAVARSAAWLPAEAGQLSITAWAVPLCAGYSLCRFAMIGLQKNWGLWLLNVADKAILLLALLTSAVVLGRTLEEFCTAYTAAMGIAFGVALMVTIPVVGGRLRFDRGYAAEALGFGMRSHLGWLAEFLNYRLDMLIVQALSGAASLGFYSAAVSAAESLWLVPNCVSVVLLPHIAGNQPARTFSTGPVCRLLFCLSVVAGAVMALLAWPLVVGLYGKAFEPAVAPLIVLLPGVAAFSIVRPLSADFAARGRPGVASTISGVSLFLTIVLDVTLIPRLGALGAALASTLSYTASACLVVILYVRSTGALVSSLLLPRTDDARMLAAAVKKLWRDVTPAGRGDVARGEI